MLQTELIPARDKESRGLMVVLHGLADSMEGYRFLPTALRLAGLNYLLVNAPDPYFTGFSWYDFAGEPDPGIRRSREALFELLDAQASRGFPPEQTMVLGFSQGGLMTMEVGMRYAHALGGLVSLSGYVHEPEKALEELSPVAGQQRFLVTHGTDDPLIPFAEVREQINLLKGAGLKIEWHELVKPHTIAGEMELQLVRDFAVSCLGMTARS